MKILNTAVLAMLVGAAIVMAATPVGSVTSSERFSLRGAVVPVEGVPNWVLLPGDDIAALSSPATINFRDGSRAVLLQGSSARIEETASGARLRLLTGSMTVRGSATPSMSFAANDSVVNALVGSTTTVSANQGQAGRVTQGRTRIGPPPGVPPPVSNR